MAETRGVENPIATDMALIGDTKAELLTKSLPRKTGPNYGETGGTKDDNYRVTD